ncbi:MAG TPA: cupin domain-containing protein [Anaerolineae bacterium]|nr:cupin domain-containing protein [Anaerolineae bacterium]HIP71814.1 cupin domain-containing protein [Anaerolineae bacterium]
MQHFEIEHLITEQIETKKPYLEFIRESSMSMGLYFLAEGSKDFQRPHNEDEVYYILTGHAMLQVADEVQPVQPGSIIFVPARIPHHFFNIVEDLTTLVFFAPPEQPTEH